MAAASKWFRKHPLAEFASFIVLGMGIAAVHQLVDHWSPFARGVILGAYVSFLATALLCRLLFNRWYRLQRESDIRAGEQHSGGNELFSSTRRAGRSVVAGSDARHARHMPPSNG